MEASANALPPVSASIICCNEAAHIDRCLSSLEWCDQVVLLDSGSTDDTLLRAAKYANVEIHEQPFAGHVQQKNDALARCRNEWVISLDADEALSDGLINEIGQLRFDVDGYLLPRHTFLGERHLRFGQYFNEKKVRLFRRSLAHWRGLNPHDSIALRGTVGELRHPILHYSYVSLEDFAARMVHYAHIGAGSLHRAGVSTYPLQPLVHGAMAFVRCYLLKHGWLHGSVGWWVAAHSARGAYRKYARLAALTRQSDSAAAGESQHHAT